MEKATETYSEYFTAVLTHDISNFNQTTRGYIEMLLNEQMGQLTEEQARALSNCLRQCRRIQSLIESVRLLAETTKTDPVVKEVSLDQAVRDAMQAVQTEFADREIRVRFTPAERMVRAETTLTNVFRHLLTNAVRYNDCEVVEVDLEIQRVGDSQPPVWKIMVADNGNGVPQARREQLFDRLQLREVHGAGLGLSLVRELVTRWGGDLWLERTSDDGTVFGISLPLAES